MQQLLHNARVNHQCYIKPSMATYLCEGLYDRGLLHSILNYRVTCCIASSQCNGVEKLFNVYLLIVHELITHHAEL